MNILNRSVHYCKIIKVIFSVPLEHSLSIIVSFLILLHGNKIGLSSDSSLSEITRKTIIKRPFLHKMGCTIIYNIQTARLNIFILIKKNIEIIFLIFRID